MKAALAVSLFFLVACVKLNLDLAPVCRPTVLFTCLTENCSLEPVCLEVKNLEENYYGKVE